MKPKVLVCVLTGTERTNWISPALFLMLVHMVRDPRFTVEVALVQNARPVEVARNHTVKLARDHRFDWLVSCDNDNFMPVGTPLDIIASAGPEQSVIGLRYGVQTQAGKYDLLPPNHIPGSGFEEVPAVAGGVLMVHRRVWEAIPRGPWFRWVHGAETETLDQCNDGCGEDTYFCRLVRQHGFKVWTHRQFMAGHYRTTDLTGMVCTMARAATE